MLFNTSRRCYALSFLLTLAVSAPVEADDVDLYRSECPACEPRTSVPFVRIAILELGMHAAASVLWPETYNPIAVGRTHAQFEESWSQPPEFHFSANVFASDNDWWYFNVFAHGLFGSEAYLAGRGWGHRPVIAALYVVFASISWEYLVEARYKRPSAIDLVWTPLSGVLLGELRYRAYLAVTHRISRRGVRKALQIILDPLGSLERRILECRIP